MLRIFPYHILFHITDVDDDLTMDFCLLDKLFFKFMALKVNRMLGDLLKCVREMLLCLIKLSIYIARKDPWELLKFDERSED